MSENKPTMDDLLEAAVHFEIIEQFGIKEFQRGPQDSCYGICVHSTTEMAFITGKTPKDVCVTARLWLVASGWKSKYSEIIAITPL